MDVNLDDKLELENFRPTVANKSELVFTMGDTVALRSVNKKILESYSSAATVTMKNRMCCNRH